MHQIARTIIFRISAVAELALLLFLIFQWSIIEIVTPLLMMFIEGPIILFFLIALLCSLVSPIWAYKKYHAWSLLPLGLNIAVSLVALFFPFTAMTINSDFYWKIKERVSVVEKIESGDLKNNTDYNSGLIHLPVGYPSLSAGGNDVIFEHDPNGKLKVLFFTYRGVVDNFAGIIFKEDNLPPAVDDFTCGTLLDSKKFQENWYWMSCT